MGTNFLIALVTALGSVSLILAILHIGLKIFAPDAFKETIPAPKQVKEEPAVIEDLSTFAGGSFSGSLGYPAWPWRNEFIDQLHGILSQPHTAPSSNAHLFVSAGMGKTSLLEQMRIHLAEKQRVKDLEVVSWKRNVWTVKLLEQLNLTSQEEGIVKAKKNLAELLEQFNPMKQQEEEVSELEKRILYRLNLMTQEASKCEKRILDQDEVLKDIEERFRKQEVERVQKSQDAAKEKRQPTQVS